MRSTYAHKYPSVFMRDPKWRAHHSISDNSTPTPATQPPLPHLMLIAYRDKRPSWRSSRHFTHFNIATTGSEWQIQCKKNTKNIYTYCCHRKKGVQISVCVVECFYVVTVFHSHDPQHILLPLPSVSGHIWWQRNDTTRSNQSPTIV